MFVVLVPTGYAELERGILAAVAEEPLVDSALGLAGVEIADGLYVTDSVDYKTFAEVTGVNEGMSMILFMRYAAAAGESFSLGYKAPILGLADYLLANIDGLPLSDEQKAAARELAETLDFARGQLVGKNYSRLVFNIAAPTESKQTFELIERLGPKIKAMCADAIFAGASMSAYDLNSSFSSDNIMISLLTVLFIYLILAVTFRSPLIPAVLVLVIQGAIFLNFSLPVVMGNNLFFFTYLIVSAIQMGATIDYAILITNRYRSLAARTDRRAAIVDAVAGRVPDGVHVRLYHERRGLPRRRSYLRSAYRVDGHVSRHGHDNFDDRGHGVPARAFVHARARARKDCRQVQAEHQAHAPRRPVRHTVL